SISGVLLLLFSIVQYIKLPFKTSFKPLLILLFTIYAAFIVSIFFDLQDKDLWVRSVFKKTTFVLLPLFFLFIRHLNTKVVCIFFFLFLISAFTCISISTINALAHFSQFLSDVAHSKNITPLIGPSHSELGVLSVVAFVMG